MFSEKYIRSKSSFVLGLVSGVALVSTIGFFVFLGLYVRRELADGSYLKSGEQQEQVVNNNNQPSQPNNPADQGGKVEVAVNDQDNIRGNKNAPITIVEFSDYQCPFCARFHETMLTVMKNYPDKVRWVFKHFPLDSIHPYARKAAEAAECAGEQNKFWEYTDNIYANQASLNTDYLSVAAKQAGLNINKFDSCLASGKFSNKVNADFQQGQNIGVRGTPGNFINGQSLPGAVPYSTIEGMIKSLL